MNEANLSRLLATDYETVKNLFPREGRRQWRLRVVSQFWALSEDDKVAYAQVPPVPESEVEEAPYTVDDDPLDAISTDTLSLGLLVRTDFSDEPAWQTFLSKLQEGELEYAAASEEPLNAESKATETDDMGDDDDGEEEGETGESSSSEASSIFHVVNPQDIASRKQLEGISNLAALRLFSDVDVRRVHGPPAGTRRIKPPNRIIDVQGWQEFYAGKMIWIYDSKSNKDQCVRVVSQKSADGVYGSATADSWRARVTHICELQVNLASGAMSIDFGGMDRWDYPERIRNMAEAEGVA
ncbi:hypothetical protein BDY19DRAFT_416183 [Irpex rosettiformis]|uniref:Uncharacterized protein n=1 Tax=Irpex rosettiformis TaxID=378272 RepID=A0ACB8UG23_9APHY|nr:hypothetical protein BDY19DRAFT_416183 [Irpex rosettiformis]